MKREHKFILLGAASVIALTAFLLSDEEKTYTTSAQRYEQIVLAKGTLQSAASSTLGPPAIRNAWNFDIVKLIDEGTLVKKGDVVAVLDVKSLRENLISSDAELSEKRRELERTLLTNAEKQRSDQLDLARVSAELDKAKRKALQPPDQVPGVEYKKLVIDRDSAKSIFDVVSARLQLANLSRKTEIQSLQFEVARLQLTVQTSKTDIEKLTLRAPRDGIVVHAQNHGEKIKAGTQIWQGQDVVELPDLSLMEVRIAIAERDAGLVKVGQLLRIKLDAAPEQQFQGKIINLSNAFRRQRGFDAAVELHAVAQILDPDPNLMRPGMSMRAEIISNTFDAAVAVPLAALAVDDDGAFVRIASLFGEQRRAVALGPRIKEFVLVEDGLLADETVLLP